MAAPASLLYGLVRTPWTLEDPAEAAKAARLKRGEDCGGILVDHGEKGARELAVSSALLPNA